MPTPRGRFVPPTTATTTKPFTTIAFSTALLFATPLFARAFVITATTTTITIPSGHCSNLPSNLPSNLLLAVSINDDGNNSGDNIPSASKNMMIHRHASRYSHSQSFQEALEVVDHDDVDETSNDDDNNHDNDNNNVIVVGHRGSLYEYVENTLAGFRRCLVELQCSIELDVYELANHNDNDNNEGTLVVFHGGDQGRLFPQIIIDDVERNIRNVTSLAELNALSFNGNYEGYVCPPEHIATAQIPTLRQVLELLSQEHHDNNNNNNRTMTIKLELKAGGPRFVQRAVALLQEFPPALIARCTFSSFHHPYLHEIHAWNNKNDEDDNNTSNEKKKTRSYNYYYRTAALFDAPLPMDFLDRAINCDEVHLRYDTCTVSTIAAAHKRGYGTMAWLCGPITMRRDLTTKWYNNDNGDDDDEALADHVVGEEALYGTLLKTGVQQICCNKPHVLLEMIESRKNKCLSPSSAVTVAAEDETASSTNA